ncbi:MAG TPA: peptide chain release factor N(5)-glutamine methyltransferase [Chitinophagaceae bacterium]|nr:peptide chain release factor N(5)-glutamine methyltransferase [Chitinophagaceae bacterium]
MTIDEARKEIIKNIRDIYEQNESNNIAELLIESITKLSRSERIIDGNRILSIAQENLLHSSNFRLQKHEPIQYIINEAWFAGMRFYVDKNVLIPRPETEELVEWVVEEYRIQNTEDRIQNAESRIQNSGFKILDVGTGSGCIAIALKNKLPLSEVWACDISDQALNIARINADALQATIDFVPLNFLDPGQRRQLPNVDVIVSNPPYVPQNEKTEMKRNVVEYEPSTALFVTDDDPLIFYKAIAEFGREKLNKGGRIYAEIHENLGEPVKGLFLSEGYQTVQLKKDLQEKDRMIKAIN